MLHRADPGNRIVRPASDMCRPLSNSDIAVVAGYAKRLGEALAQLGSAVIDACPPDDLAAYAEWRVREQKQADDAARIEAEAAEKGCAS
jgi:hypothetical protein